MYRSLSAVGAGTPAPTVRLTSRRGLAATAARRVLLIALSTVVLLSSGVLTTAAFADEADVDMGRLRAQLFVGNERLNVTGNAFWLRGMEQAYLLDYRANHPGVTQEQLVTQLAWYDQILRSRGLYDGVERPVYQIITGGLQALADAGVNPALSGGASAVKSLLDLTLGAQVNDYVSVMDSVTGAWQTHGFIRDLNTIMDGILQQTLRKSESDQAFGNARDAFFGGLSRASVYNTIDQFLADPQLSTWINTQAIIDLLQSGAIEHDALVSLVRNEFSQLGVKLDQLRNTQVTTVINNSATYQVIENGPRGNAEAYASAVASAQVIEQRLEMARTGVNVLSALIGLADPKLGKQIGILGNAAVQIASAVNRYLPTIMGMGIGQALTSMSTVVLTGNLIGAVMTLLPLFVDAGPTPEQMILQQVQELRMDLAQMAQGIDQRLNRIEAGLNTIYGDMLAQFGQITTLLGGITEHLTEIGHVLVTLQSRLDELGQRLLAVSGAVYLYPLRSKLNFALGYQQRYNRPLPDSEFIAAENTFEAWAVNYALDEGSTNAVAQYGRLQNVDIDPALGAMAAPNSEFVGGELARNLGYLTWLAGYRFGYGINARNIPNPLTWSMAARSYARLIAENPVIAGTITAQPEVRNKGALIDNLVRELSQPASGTTNGLYTALMANYDTSVRDVSGALRSERESVQAGRAVNLFGDAWQATAPVGTVGTIASCAGAGSLATPANIQPTGLPNPVYTALAGYRAGPGAPVLQTCYTISVRETDTVAKPKLITTYGAADMTLQNRIRLSDGDGWRVVRSTTGQIWSGTLRIENLNSGVVSTYDPVSIISNGWANTYKARAEALSTTVDNAAVEAVAGAVTGHLRGEAQRYYNNVLARLGQPGSLRTSVMAMTGAATLLRAYVRLGFPKALDGDDLMNAMLSGVASIFAETPDGPMVSRTFATASLRYVPCPPGQTTGCTPVENVYNPLWNQPHLTTGLPAPAGVVLPGDPVGDALVSSALARKVVLGERITLHSQRIAAGQHREGLPMYEEVEGRLRLAQSIVDLG